MRPTFARIEAAKEETRQRIRAAAESASAGVAVLLREIAERVFESSFDASALRRAVRPTERVMIAFKNETGFTLARYVFEQRMRTAKVLLETTNLDVCRIAREVRSVSERRFSSTFRRWAGLRPLEVRAASRGREARDRDRLWRLWFRVWLYALAEEESREARGLNRAQRSAPKGDRRTPYLDRLLERIEARLSNDGVEVTRRLCGGLALTGDAMKVLFEALGKRGREEGRKDRRRGVEFAEVALGLVEGSGDVELLALGWARLGNARRVAGDLEGAELAVRHAGQEVTEGEAVSATKAEILCYQGSLRFYQRRFAEAETLLSSAIIYSREAEASCLEVGALQQRAYLRWYQGNAIAGIPDLYIALDRTEQDDLRSRLVSTQLLVLANLALQDHAETAKLLPTARELASQVDDKPSELQVQWLEGLYRMSQGDPFNAERLLKEARAGFAKLRDGGMRAIISLDLSLIYEEQGRTSDVLEFASEALSTLEALRLPEAVGALQLLRRALVERRVQRSVIEEARHLLLMS